MSNNKVQIDHWAWGNEQIIWGFAPDHSYTFKILEPKKGRAGCCSLQYHDHKSESWLVVRGAVWVIVATEGQVATRVMHPGDVQNLPTGVIHRFLGCTDDVQIAEPSTPDAHAANKSVAKDVVRLHCVHGRPVVPARSEAESKLVAQAIDLTEAAIACVERGEVPTEHNRSFLDGRGALRI